MMVYHLSVYCLQFLYVQTQTSWQRKGEAGQDPKYSKQNLDLKFGTIQNHSSIPQSQVQTSFPATKLPPTLFPSHQPPPIHPPTADGFRRIRTEAAGENGWLRSRRDLKNRSFRANTCRLSICSSPFQAYKLTKKVTLATCFLSTCCSKQLSKGAPNGNKTELQSAHCLLLVHLLFEECEVADLLIFYRALNHMQTGSFWSFLTKLSNSPRICRSDKERISHQMVKTGVFQQALSRLFHLLWISRTLPDECLKSRLYQISESIAKAAQFITYNDQHLSWFQRKKCALPQSQPTDATNSIMLWQDDLSCRFIQKHRELEGLSSTQASQPCTNKNTSNFWP